jgi:phospholipase C
MASALDLVDTIVIVILENRSFGHMLGYRCRCKNPVASHEGH